MYKRLIAVQMAFCMLLALVFFPLPAKAETALAGAPLSAGNTQNGMVRVRLAELENLSVLNFTVYGSYSVNGQASRTLSGGAAVTVRFNSSTGQWSLTVGGTTSNMGSSFRLCRHETSGQNGVKISQGRVPANLYPGDFQFISKSNNGNYVSYIIAHIYMEDYLYGVLPYEMGNSSGMEALKAQAVAARTYTMMRMSKMGASQWDVVDTTADQVYSGTPSDSANCKAAIDATKGIAVKNGASFTATYYTASNGGQTESIKNAWGTGGLPYLGVKDDPYDLANPDSRKASFSVQAYGSQSNSKLGSLLNQKAASVFGSGATVTAVTAVTPHTPKYAAPSRLYTKLDFDVQYTRNGQLGFGVLTFDIFGELESALSMNVTSGSNELWSVTQHSSGFTVTARRYGHGIGMSQRGAMYMDKLGYTYDQILAFYYEGCTRVEYTLTRSVLGAIGSGQEGQQQIIPEQPVSLETPAPSAGPGLTARVATQSGSLNLRQKPSTGAKVLCTIPQNEIIPVLSQDGTWSQTAYRGFTGYVMTAYLSFSSPAAEATPTPAAPPADASQYAQVTTQSGSLNLRSAPNAGAKILRTIPQYQVIPVLESGASWCRVSYNGDTGYVMTGFLTFLSGPSAAVTPAPTVSPAATLPPASGSVSSARVVTSSGSLNLREYGRDTARVLRTIPQYDTVSVLEHGAVWCHVAYAGTVGYVMTKFLSFEGGAVPTQPVPTAAPASSGLHTLITPVVGRIMTPSGSLNLRDACSTSARVILEMPNFDLLIITAVGDTWCAVKYEGYSGFCMTKYLEFETYE